MKQERLSAATQEHWKEKVALRKLEIKWIKINDESEEDECLETFSYDDVHLAYASD